MPHGMECKVLSLGSQGIKDKLLCNRNRQEFGDGEKAERENQRMRWGEGATRGGELKKIEEQFGDFPGGPVAKTSCS